MKKCPMCNIDHDNERSIYCSKQCSKKYRWKIYYQNNKDTIINRAAKWNIDNREKRNKRDSKKALTIYRTILQRCNDKKYKQYNDYGAKGIKCLLSQEDFLQIHQQDKCNICRCELNNENRNSANGKTVDRIDNNGHYEINNIQIICRSCNNKKDHTKISNEQKEQIKKEYIKHSKQYGTVSLAKKYDVSQDTIWRIVNNR